MTSFQKRGKTWSYNISHTVNGKRKQIRKEGFRTKKEAEIAALEVENSLKIDRVDKLLKHLFGRTSRNGKKYIKPLSYLAVPKSITKQPLKKLKDILVKTD